MMLFLVYGGRSRGHPAVTCTWSGCRVVYGWTRRNICKSGCSSKLGVAQGRISCEQGNTNRGAALVRELRIASYTCHKLPMKEPPKRCWPNPVSTTRARGSGSGTISMQSGRLDISAEKLPDVFDALRLLLLVRHHAKGRCTRTGQSSDVLCHSLNQGTYMNFFLSCILSILCSTLSFTMKR